MTFVRNRSYVAAWDSQVDRAPLPRTICGEPIVLWRKLDRGVVALRDACPHRLVPLSMGIRVGNSMRCRYHGLLVDPDGIAEEMPVKDERVHRSVCAPAYQVVERHRYIWVWIGARALADSAAIPDF